MRIRTLFWVAGWAVLLGGIGLLLGLRSYHVFTEEDLVGIVRCEPAGKGSPGGFVLEFTPVHGKSRAAGRRFPMAGDQWTIGGEFLKWHPWLNWLGFKSCFKLTRLSSRHLKAEDELRGPRAVYDLNGGTDLLWRVLYRVGNWIPLVEAVYGNAAHVMAQPGTRWGVYVTLSGFLIKPLSRGGAAKD